MGPGSMVSAEVAKGKYEAVMTLVSEIITVAGVVPGGLVPDAMGLGTPFEAGLVREPEATAPAGAFLEFLRTEAATALMRSTGLVTQE